MAERVIMPKAGMAMEFGTIIKWLKEVGDRVENGEPLLDIETDKVTMTVESMSDGYLIGKLYDDGDEVPVVTTIGYIGEKDEKPPAEETPAVQQTAQTVEQAESDEPAVVKADGAKVLATPAARRLAKEKGVDLGTLNDGHVIKAADVERAGAAVKATALAKKLAAMSNVDLNSVAGSGSHGKIVKSDVLAAVSQSAPKEQTERVVALTGMRKAVARNMKASQNENAQTTHRTQCDMSSAVKLRQVYKEVGKKVSYNDIVLRAVARTLTEFPMMNASWSDEGIIVKEYVNLGVAVALDEGLIVPNIKNAQTMTLEQLGEASKALAAAAKENRLTMDDYSGGTFTVSNLGMFGLDDFVAIINPPEAGILAVGRVAKKVVVVDDDMVIRPMMTLTLSYDHRVVDGAPAARFLMRVKELIENPCLML